jgi:leucyl aminopeptidase (aminopeptidase T)
MEMPDSSDLARKACQNILTKYLRVKKGENVAIETWTHCIRMAGLMVDEARKLGAKTLVHYEDEQAFWAALDRKQENLLGAASEPEFSSLKSTDAYVFFWGPEVRPMGDPHFAKAYSEATKYNAEWYKLGVQSGLRGVRMELGNATDFQARFWGEDGPAWREKLLRGCLADPREMARIGARLAKALAGNKKIRIRHDNGTNIEVRLKGVPAQVNPGFPEPENGKNPLRILASLPAGVLRIALDETYGEGTVVANRRSYPSFGIKPLEGANLTFHNGTLEKREFSQGGDWFEASMKQGGKGANQLGIMHIGLNSPLGAAAAVEDEELAAVLIGVGGNKGLGGTNPGKFFGFAVVAGSEVSVDGRPILREGKVL